MNISHRVEDQLCVLQMRGRIIVDNIEEWETYIGDHTQDTTLQGVVMDFNETEIMDSSGIGFIISCYHTFNRNGIPLVLCNLNRYKQIFSMTGLDKILSIFDSEEEALQSFTINS